MERMTVSAARLPKALDDLAGREHLSEAVLLSTCMRTEIYVVAEQFHGALASVRNFLAEQSFTAPEDFGDHLYSHWDDAAISHLFSVASGLDSAVLGEGEILGQVRRAAEVAREERTCGPLLSGLFRSALEVGKRARTETNIARGVTSISQAAAALAVEHLGSLAGRPVLVLGAGDTGEGMTVALRAGGADVLVANRTWRKAVDVAHRVGGTPVEMGDLPAHLVEVDVLLTSTSTDEVVIEAADLKPVMAARAGRPLLIVDVAMPRDVDPAAGMIEGVTLLDMSDLKRFAEAGRADRAAEVAQVRVIIEDELGRFRSQAAERQMAPLFASLRERADTLRLAELERFSGRLAELDDRQREAVEALTKGIVAKLLHEPTVGVKLDAGTAKGARLADALRTLFDLP